MSAIFRSTRRSPSGCAPWFTRGSSNARNPKARVASPLRWHISNVTLENPPRYMITEVEAFPLLLEACPSFETAYAEHVAHHGETLPYVAAAALTSHMLELHLTGNTAPLLSLGKAIERLHLEGNEWVREFATIGLLEGVQNGWLNAGAEPTDFVAYLGPESLSWWKGLIEFWCGKSPVVRAVRNE